MSEEPGRTTDSRIMDDQLFDAARSGDVVSLGALLDKHPDGRCRHNRVLYEWSLLHAAAHNGHLAAVDLLLTRGIDVTYVNRETTPVPCTGPRPTVTWA